MILFRQKKSYFIDNISINTSFALQEEYYYLITNLDFVNCLLILSIGKSNLLTISSNSTS
jgi:hypothetical protein